MQENLSVAYSPVRGAQRFKADKRALVWCHQGEESLPYHLIDISQAGLSFRYRGKPLEIEHIGEVSLFNETTKLVESIPVGPVSDQQIEDGIVPVRRASLHFRDMDEVQTSELEHFIRKHCEQI